MVVYRVVYRLVATHGENIVFDIMSVDIVGRLCYDIDVGKRPRIPSDMEQAILEAIEASGMTQLELAARSGVPQATLSRFMSSDPSARRTITLPVADKLCKALGLELVKTRQPKKG